MQFTEFEDALKKAKLTRQLNQILIDYLASFSLTTFAFTYYENAYSEAKNVKYEFATKDYKLWHDYYISEGFDKIDTTSDIVKQTSIPVYWNIKNQIKQAKTPAERKIREDSQAFGIEAGLSIPINGPHNNYAILLIIQMRDNNKITSIENIKPQLFTAAYFYFHHLQLLLLKSKKPNQYSLTEREMQCLKLLAQQYTVPAIAKTLCITEQGVNYHIQKIIKKFRVKNKYQAVLSALNKNIIKL